MWGLGEGREFRELLGARAVNTDTPRGVLVVTSLTHPQTKKTLMRPEEMAHPPADTWPRGLSEKKAVPAWSSAPGGQRPEAEGRHRHTRTGPRRQVPVTKQC